MTLTPWQAQPWRPAIAGIIAGAALFAAGMLCAKLFL
jgi:hypothetical protein